MSSFEGFTYVRKYGVEEHYNKLQKYYYKDKIEISTYDCTVAELSLFFTCGGILPAQNVLQVLKNAKKVEIVQVLVQQCAINMFSQLHQEFIFDALVRDGKYDVVNFLLQYGTRKQWNPISPMNEKNCQALRYAIDANHLPMVQLLIKYGAKARDEHMIWAAKQPTCSADIFKALHGAGGNALASEQNGYDLARLIIASRAQDVQEKLHYLIESCHVPLHTTCVHSCGNLDVFQYACFCLPFEPKVIQYLLSLKQVDPNHYQQTESWSPLYLSLCSAQVHPDTIKALLHSTMHKNTKCTDDNNPLFIAMQHGAKPSVILQLIKLLVAAKYSVNPLSSKGQSALSIACTIDCPPIFTFLLESGANLKHTTKDGQNCLHIASFHHAKHIVPLIVSKAPQLIHEKDKKGNTPLAYAESYEIANFLLSNKASIQCSSTEPLQLLDNALTSVDAEFVKLAISQYSQSELKQSMHKFIIKAFEDELIFMEVVKHVDVPSFRDEQGNTLLHIAFRYPNYNIIKYILSTSIDVNANNSKGKPAILHFFHQSNLQEIYSMMCIAALIKTKQFAIDKVMKKGKLLMDFACEHKQSKQLIQILLECGANPNVKLTNGKYLIQHAVDQRDTETVSNLIAAGVDSSVANLTVIMVGKSHKDEELRALFTWQTMHNAIKSNVCTAKAVPNEQMRQEKYYCEQCKVYCCISCAKKIHASHKCQMADYCKFKCS